MTPDFRLWIKREGRFPFLITNGEGSGRFSEGAWFLRLEEGNAYRESRNEMKQRSLEKR